MCDTTVEFSESGSLQDGRAQKGVFAVSRKAVAVLFYSVWEGLFIEV